MMDKLSKKDKMHIHTLHELRFGLKVITASYPDKHWSLSTLQAIRCQVNETGSAMRHRACSRRPKSVLLQLVNTWNTV